MKLELSAAIYRSGRGFRARSLEFPDVDEGEGATVEEARDDLQKKVKEAIGAVDAPFGAHRPFIGPIEVVFSHYELAGLCNRLRKERKYSGDQIVRFLGRLNAPAEWSSKSHVNNMADAFESLHPAICQEWKAGNPAAGPRFLNELKALPPEEQLQRWKAKSPKHEDES